MFPAIRIEAIRKRCGALQALDGVSLDQVAAFQNFIILPLTLAMLRSGYKLRHRTKGTRVPGSPFPTELERLHAYS